jgi:dATP pyrophosphohydrolase
VLLIKRADSPALAERDRLARRARRAAGRHRRREVAEETGITQGELRDWQYHNVYEIYPTWRHRYAPGVTHNTEHVFGLTLPARCR